MEVKEIVTSIQDKTSKVFVLVGGTVICTTHTAFAVKF